MGGRRSDPALLASPRSHLSKSEGLVSFPGLSTIHDAILTVPTLAKPFLSSLANVAGPVERLLSNS